LKIGIIGAGIAGLASAARMASKGHQVEVWEANEYPGGKLSELKLGEYRFDAGPSLFTMPAYVESLFEIAGEACQNHFTYKRLDVVCNYFWEDGTQLSAFADPEKFALELKEKLGIPEGVLEKILLECC